MIDMELSAMLWSANYEEALLIKVLLDVDNFVMGLNLRQGVLLIINLVTSLLIVDHKLIFFSDKQNVLEIV